MTLCSAWIREKGDIEELVFATDSTLTGGEKWNQGVKLFELPRSDCLLCFAGSTNRAYPLILNLISSIKLNKRLRSPHTDVAEVLDYISTTFTSLVETVVKEIATDDIHRLRAEAKFLFGGWSWLQSRFRIWKLYYSQDAEGFVFQDFTNDPSKARKYAFLGDPVGEDIDIEKMAGTRLRELFNDDERFDDKLDLEPLRILIDICRDSAIRPVDGAIQVAKVYKSGSSEFFGVYWPSIDGRPFFQGREFTVHNKPEARYIDPDTLEVVEDQLPVRISELSTLESVYDFEFIKTCYSEEGYLVNNLSTANRERLISVLREIAYITFVKRIEGREANQ